MQNKRDKVVRVAGLVESLQARVHSLEFPVCLQANSCDHEGGILTGNWSGNYSGGRAPTSWSGSVDILREYVEKKRPVKYAQCWVFSGVLTTRTYTESLHCGLLELCTRNHFHHTRWLYCNDLTSAVQN